MRSIALFSLSFLLAVIFWDLKFDFALDKSHTLAYYKNMGNVVSPLNLVIPVVIVLLLVSLVYNLTAKRKLFDFVTFLLNVGSLFIYVSILIPNQDELRTLELSNPRFHHNAMVNQKNHLILLGITSASVIMQYLSISSESASRKEKEN